MPTIPQKRFFHRLVAHHLPIFAISAVAVFLLYVTRPYKDVLTKLSFSTAYPALVLVAITLLIGPWNLMRGKRMPISSDLRRDIGIWAGILAIVHTAVGQNVHLRGRPWLYYVYSHKEAQAHIIPLRHDLFGFANYTGLFSVLVVLLLLATSNDYSLRALGTPQWKQLQRWNYFAFAFAGAHAIGYQLVEKQKIPFVTIVIVSLVVTILFQAIGFRLRGQLQKRRA